MKRARTVTGWLLLGLLGGAVAQGCGSSTHPKRNPSSGANAGKAGNDGTSTTVQPQGNGGGGGASEYNPLCGIPDTNFCVPDFDTNAVCLEVVGGRGGSGGRGGRGGAGTGAMTSTGGSSPGTGGSGPGTGGSMSSTAGAGGESGTDGSEGGMSQGGVGAAAGESASNGAQSGQGGENSGGAGQASLGGEPGTGGSVTTSGTSGTSQASAGRAGGTAVTASSSCQVIESPNHKGSPLATCRPAGTGMEGSPCFSGADCAPKFACIGGGPGQCRAYCCSGPDQCQAYTGTHCAVEPLVPDAKSTRVLSVPVCMPAVKCSLAEPFPCPDGTCSCPAETACVVVSDDGTTSCVPASDLPTEDVGGMGDPCPCARGFVCSQAAHTCVKLCEVAATGGCRCQASAALPAGWGTCVGVSPKDAGAP